MYTPVEYIKQFLHKQIHSKTTIYNQVAAFSPFPPATTKFSTFGIKLLSPARPNFLRRNQKIKRTYGMLHLIAAIYT